MGSDWEHVEITEVTNENLRFYLTWSMCVRLTVFQTRICNQHSHHATFMALYTGGFEVACQYFASPYGKSGVSSFSPVCFSVVSAPLRNRGPGRTWPNPALGQITPACMPFCRKANSCRSPLRGRDGLLALFRAMAIRRAIAEYFWTTFLSRASLMAINLSLQPIRCTACRSNSRVRLSGAKVGAGAMKRTTS